jgi:hypothetical protein
VFQSIDLSPASVHDINYFVYLISGLFNVEVESIKETFFV